MDILSLCSVIVMVTPITVEDNPHEDDDLIYAGEYLDIAGTPKSDYAKRLAKSRFEPCRNTRQECFWGCRPKTVH